MLLSTPIHCKLSGIRIGTLEMLTVAGTLPYLRSWSDVVCHHPVFSMPTAKLLDFTLAEHNRLASVIEDNMATEAEQQILQVCHLALLHKLDCIVQDRPGLAPLRIVRATLQGVANLAKWKHYLESKRFRFPAYHLSPLNNNLNFSNLPDYLDVCYSVKHDYETKTRDIEEKAKIAAAAAAMQALKNEWVTPVSKKVLWNWVKAWLPDKYKVDADNWLGALFLGGSQTIRAYDEDEIALAEEIIISSVPMGTGMLSAVRGRLDEIKTIWTDHNKAWEVIESPAQLSVNGIPYVGEEPKEKDFPSRGKFIQAHSRWQLSKKALERHQQKQAHKEF